MTDINVRQAELKVRTAKVTRSLLKQLRRITSQTHPKSYENHELKPDRVVGWIHGSVLGDEYDKYAIVNLGNGDWGLTGLSMNEHHKYKQIYIS